MTTDFENRIAADVARALIREEAPQEIPIFKANSEAYFKNPARVLAQQTPGKEDMLGFGVAEATTFLTPVVLAVMGEVVTFLIAEVKKAFEKEGSSRIEQTVRNLFRKLRGPEEKPAVTLTQDQLREVHKRAFAKALMLKLSDARARQLADAIVSDLVL
jgi:hypothetical protein